MKKNPLARNRPTNPDGSIAPTLLRGLLAYAAVFGALSIYWWAGRAHFTFYGLDEYGVFSEFSRDRNIAEQLRAVIAPHGRHLAPVFKALFLIEFRAFGLSPLPYHVVTMALISLSVILFWRFLRDETSSAHAATLGAVLFGANTAYFSVVAWVFLQQFILTATFIIMGLLAVREGRCRSARGTWAAALFSLLASLTLSLGAVAWAVVGGYCLSRHMCAPEAERHGRAGVALAVLPFAVSAGLTLLIYTGQASGVISWYSENVSLKPVTIIVGALMFAGALLVVSIGGGPGVKLVAQAADGGPDARRGLVLVLMVLALAGSAVVAALAVSRAGRERRGPIIYACACVAALSVFTVAANLSLYADSPWRILSIVRYYYFPFMFAAMFVAFCAADADRRAKPVLAACAVVWLGYHAAFLGMLSDTVPLRTAPIDRVLSIVKRSVDYPIAPAGGPGVVSMADAPSRGSRAFEDIDFFEATPSYADLLNIFKAPDELVAANGDAFVYLRHFEPVPLGSVAAPRGSRLSVVRDTLNARNPGGVVRLQLPPESMRPGPLEHVSFRARSPRDTEVVLVCADEKGNRTGAAVEDLEASFLYRRMVFPCPLGAWAEIIALGKEIKVRDLRVYY